MLRVILCSTLILSLTTMLGLTACAEPNDEPSATPRTSDLPVSTLILDVAIPSETDKATVEAIARSAETLAGTDLTGVRIKAKQLDDAQMILAIEVWGPELANPDAIIEQLRAEHPSLVDASITVSQHEGPPDDEPIAGPAGEHDDESPEQTKARVIEELRAQGVEGEIAVEVIDDEHGRRVEVQVEDKR